MRAAKQIASDGRFDAFAEAASHPETNGFFRDDLKQRS